MPTPPHIFSPPAFAAPLPAPNRPPTPNRLPLKCLQACLQAGSPLPHRTTSVTALTTGRSGLDLLKDPGRKGGACPSLPAWLTDGLGFRPVALQRETKGKVPVPTPIRQPLPWVPSSLQAFSASRGPLGLGGPSQSQLGSLGRGLEGGENILDGSDPPVPVGLTDRPFLARALPCWPTSGG